MRCSLTGRAVPSCWAHRLTRSSSIMPRDVAHVVGGRAGWRKSLPQFVVRVLYGVHSRHPLAVGVDALRQPLEATADRR